MPRIRQYAERYAVEDFWKEIDRCCPLAGIQSENSEALGEKTGVSGHTIRNYKKRLEIMRFDVLRKLVTILHPNPAVILKTLGYSEKEIKKYAREYGQEGKE